MYLGNDTYPVETNIYIRNKKYVTRVPFHDWKESCFARLNDFFNKFNQKKTHSVQSRIVIVIW